MYRVLERLGYVTLLECRLETGRTHQIRVHTEHMGIPFLEILVTVAIALRKGDSLHKIQTSFVEQLFLGSCRVRHFTLKTLGFIHPVLEKRMEFHAPLPKILKPYLENGVNTRLGPAYRRSLTRSGFRTNASQELPAFEEAVLPCAEFSAIMACVHGTKPRQSICGILEARLLLEYSIFS